MIYETLVAEIRQLPVADRKRLITDIVESLTEPPIQKTHSILEFEGIGHSLYDGTDAQDEVNQMRDEWDTSL